MASFFKVHNQCNPVDKIKALRNKIETNKLVKVIGAHNAISAKIGESIGFDAIWASSFEISASFGLPDASLVSLDKYVQIVRDINNAIDIPMIVDCDSGFGNAVNAVKMAYDMEQAGAAGICIEDNLYPKKCSFYSGKRLLISSDEHAHKISEIKKVTRRSGMFVIARTEAFIANWGLEEALRRAAQYVDAGADAILVHSKKSTPEEIYAFSDAWNLPVPLVCVPTTYHNVHESNHLDRGYGMIIYANHALRSSIAGMKSKLKKLYDAGHAAPIEDEIVSLEDVFDLVEHDYFKQIEKSIP